jgi:hypothetical protein
MRTVPVPMAFGEITKQLAQQALGNTLSDALEGKPAPAQPETAGGTILAQIQAMQRALKPEEELVVLFRTGPETIRVLEFYAPSWQVLVLTGLDSSKNVTRIVSSAESLQLVCKVMQAHAPAKPIRINFITPKPKSE